MLFWKFALLGAVAVANPVSKASQATTASKSYSTEPKYSTQPKYSTSAPPTYPTSPSGGSGQACAAVSASSASQVKANPSATPVVDAKTAYDCLNSVALNQANALKLVEGILPYVEWQSTTAYLKNPPSGYQEPAVDLHAEFNTIQQKIRQHTYANEYQFQADLFRVFNLAHDGHFRFFPDLLSAALRFARGVSLVSVSLDGTSIPQVYTHSDMEAYVAGNKKVSPVKTINGEDAVTFLENLSQLGPLQDPDALYNVMFYSKPFAAASPGWEGYFAGSGRFGFIFPGLTTTIGFQNGTSHTYHATSQVIGDFSGVTDGPSFYAKFCSGEPNAMAPAPATASPTAIPSTAYTPISSPTPTGYPQPVIVTADDIVSGYYLDGANSDVAVLSMLAMENESPAEFQAVVQDFIADAKKKGKKKLVVDVSANGGGYILIGYDIFRQLFPHITQDGYNRFRSSTGFQDIATQYATALKNYKPTTGDFNEIAAAESPLNYKYDYNINDQPFPSLKSKIGPYEYQGDNFTAIQRWNLNDPLTTTNTTYGIGMQITGYGDRSNFQQPWAAEDIIVLYDGYCASTCTLFAEFLRTQAGVKSVAIGGRPSRNAMQAIGGVKGANNADFTYQNFLATYALSTLPANQRNSPAAQEFKRYQLYPYYRATDTSINLRDNILPANLGDGVPAQFIYEPADCRIFYTPQMVTDVSQMWQMAANVAWGSASCVQGHLDLPKRTAPYQQINMPVDPIAQLQRDFPVLDKYPGWAAVHGQRVPA